MWLRVSSVLILGYLSLSRAFAYLGIPAWNVFIGEAVLALLVLCGPKMGHSRWPWLSRKFPALRSFLILYGLFLGYGIVQVFRGIELGNPPLMALRDLCFNYYAVYFFLGLWAGLKRPDLLPKLLRGFAWFNGIYGTLYIVVLNSVYWFWPGLADETVPVQIFAQPIYSFVALLGLLAYEKDLWGSWYLLLLNGFVMLGMQIRTEWLALAVGVIVWCVATRHGKRVLQAGVVLTCMLMLMYITDLRLPGPELRGGGDISIRQLVDRAASPFRSDISDQRAAAGVGEVETQEATFVWRTVWWFAIWNSVHADTRTALFGHGYGFPLGDLVPYLEGEFIRTPHNEFFYALGYTGWTGVALFFLFQFGILRLVWRASRTTGQWFGVVYWAAMMTFGLFFPLGETPYGAIPFYLITGWFAAPIMLRKETVSIEYKRGPSVPFGRPVPASG